MYIEEGIATLGVFFTLVISFFLYMKWHRRVIVEKMIIPAKLYVYINHTGNYKNLFPLFAVIQREVLPHFKNSYLATLYYDNPCLLVDKNSTRASVGALIDTSQKDIAEQFVNNNSQYMIKELPSVEAAWTSIFYRNSLSFIWVGMQGYQNIFNFIQTNNLLPKGKWYGTMEVYHWNEKPSTVEMITPISQNGEEWCLSGDQTPILKPSRKFK